MVSDNSVPKKKNGESLTPSPPTSPSLVNIPPSVMAISNLRCPSPPPILNKSTSRTENVSPTLSLPNPDSSVSIQEPVRDIVGTMLNERKNQASGNTDSSNSKHLNSKSNLNEIPCDSGNNDHVSNFTPIHENITPNNSSASLDFIAAPPGIAEHHKSPSVHAHFPIQEVLKPGKLNNRSRSGSGSATASDSQLTNYTSYLDQITNTTMSPHLGKYDMSNLPMEQNANIDPRLPQDDGKIHVLFGVCGALSTGKIKNIISKLFEIYTPSRISIQIILTKSSENFISPESLHYLETTKEIRIWRDSDEWNTWKMRSDPVLHIELRRWADILVVCPLTANTLSKISLGLCDNLLTNVIRAWNTIFPILLAPAMISYSYNAVTTKRQLRLIAEEMPWIELLKPVEKVIGSYGDIGMGGMMDWNEIVNKIVLKLGGYPDDESENGKPIQDSPTQEDSQDLDQEAEYDEIQDEKARQALEPENKGKEAN